MSSVYGIFYINEWLKKTLIFKDNVRKFVWHVSNRQFKNYSEIHETYAESLNGELSVKQRSDWMDQVNWSLGKASIYNAKLE